MSSLAIERCGVLDEKPKRSLKGLDFSHKRQQQNSLQRKAYVDLKRWGCAGRSWMGSMSHQEEKLQGFSRTHCVQVAKESKVRWARNPARKGSICVV